MEVEGWEDLDALPRDALCLEVEGWEDLDALPRDALCLEVEGWEDLDVLPREATSSSNLSENEPAAKPPRLSLSLCTRVSSAATMSMRFEFLDNVKEEALSKKFVPMNTE